MQNRIITISREFGSGGRTIGKMTAKKLGIPCYDQELIEKIAKKSGFTKEFVEERGEHSQHGGWFANAFTDRGMNGISSQDYLWGIQRDIIMELSGVWKFWQIFTDGVTADLMESFMFLYQPYSSAKSSF